MSKYYSEKFFDYYYSMNVIGSKDVVIQNIKTSIEEATNMINGAKLCFEDFSGDFKEELDQNLNSIYERIDELNKIFEEDFPKVEEAINNLSENMDDYIAYDKQIDYYDDEISQFEANPINEDNPKYENFKREYEASKNQRIILCEQIEAVIEVMQKDIKVIEDFNASFDEYTLISGELYNKQIELEDIDVESLTNQEKIEIFEIMIQSLTERYMECKETLDKYMNLRLCEEYGAVVEIATAVGLFNGIDMSGIDFYYAGMTSVENRVDFINKYIEYFDENNFYDCVKKYLVDGYSFEESGLEELMRKSYSHTNQGVEFSSEFLFNDFCEKIGEYQEDTGLSNSELFTVFKNELDFIREAPAKILEASNNMDTAGLAIKGYKHLKAEASYLDYYGDDFEEYCNNWVDDQLQRKIDINDYNNLTVEERRKASYLYDKYGKNVANSYIDGIREFINYREGYAKAIDAYNRFGSNAGANSIIGFSDGISDFFEGFHHLCDPTQTFSVNDYSQLFYSGMVKEAGGFNSIAYSGTYAGGKALIPTVATVVTQNPGLGFALSTVSEAGNKMHELMTEGETSLDPMASSMSWGQAAISVLPEATAEAAVAYYLLNKVPIIDSFTKNVANRTIVKTAVKTAFLLFK